jgi:hypothetical protein
LGEGAGCEGKQGQAAQERKARVHHAASLSKNRAQVKL